MKQQSLYWRLQATLDRLRPVHGFGLAALLVLAGAGYSIILGPELVFPDERQYFRIAQNMLAGKGFSLDGMTPTAVRPPGYSIFLLLPLACYDSVHSARIANFLLLAISMGLLYRLIRPFAGASAARLSILLVLCYPVLLYTAGTLYPQTLALFLITAILWLLLVGKDSAANAGMAGGCLGMLALVTPTCLFVLPLVVVLAPILRCWQWRHTLIAAMLAVAIIGAWTARNQVALGEPVFISSNVATILNKVSTSAAPAAPADDRLSIEDGSRSFIGQRLDALLRNPKDYFGKLANYFQFSNRLQTSAEESRVKDIVMFMSYYSLLLLAIMRYCLYRRIRLTSLDLWVALIYFGAAFFQALAYTRIRYRLPMDFLMTGMAAVSLHWLLQRLPGRPGRAPA